MRQILKLALLRSHTHQETQHPSADLLAAFTENTLAAFERNIILEHLSGCAACREWLSYLSERPLSRHNARFVWKPAMAIAAGICAFTFAIRVERQNAPTPLPLPALVRIPPPQEIHPPTAHDVRVAVAKRPAHKSKLLWRIDTAEPPVLQRSGDGGKSWIVVTPTPSFRIHSVSWADNMTWVRDDHGQMLQSQDAGAHWQTVDFSVPDQITPAVAKATISARDSGKIYVLKTATAH